MAQPDTRYAKTLDSVFIAYQVVGDGSVDLVWHIGWPGNLDVEWEVPSSARWMGGLASFSRLILHDHRGVGLSSRNVAVPNLETRVADLRVVLDAIGAALGTDPDQGFLPVNLWDDVLARIENDNKVNRHSFATWFRPTNYLALDGSQLVVGVPNAQFKEWLTKIGYAGK
jgi:hypothetical protein